MLGGESASQQWFIRGKRDSGARFPRMNHSARLSAEALLSSTIRT
jgi:hypothetical protein